MNTKLIVGAVIAGVIGITALSIHLMSLNPLNPTHGENIKVGNMERRFTYYTPKNLVKHPKLIFALHPAGGHPHMMQTITAHEFDHFADRNGEAIIVYPAAYAKYWNDCRKAGNYASKKENIDEIAFFNEMISWFQQNYNIDTNSVFAVGFSIGGQMCYKLAKQMPGKFKGVAAAAACLPTDENNDCVDKHLPISVLVMNGTADPFNLYKGGEMVAWDGQKRGTLLSTDETVAYWCALGNCDTQPVQEISYPDVNKNDESTAHQSVYENKVTHKRVALVKVEGGGHIFPNPNFSIWPGKLGVANEDINGPEVVWNFFMGL